MIERVLIQTLRTGLAARVAAPSTIVRMCTEGYGLVQSEADAVAKIFVAEPPSVAMQYPREDSKFPLVSVILVDERESTQYINAGHTRYIGTRHKRASIWEQKFALWVSTKHPDLTLYLYAMVKDIMLASRDDLVASGVVVSSYAGSDMGPNADYAPFWLFIRQLLVSATQQREVFDETVPLIRDVVPVAAQETTSDFVKVEDSITP